LFLSAPGVSIKAMTTNDNILRVQVRLPNEPGATQAAQQAALQKAAAALGPGEQVAYITYIDGVMEKAGDTDMLFTFDCAILRRGGQAARRN
jgi:hypothetical protein